MGRTIAAVVAGALVVGLAVTLLQTINLQLHPLPEGLDPADPADAEAFADYVAGMPAAAWGIAFVSELIGALLGALTTGMMARDRKGVFAAVIVTLALGGSIFNWTAFSHPAWFMIGQCVGYGLVMLLVTRFLSSLSAA